VRPLSFAITAGLVSVSDVRTTDPAVGEFAANGASRTFTLRARPRRAAADRAWRDAAEPVEGA